MVQNVSEGQISQANAATGPLCNTTPRLALQIRVSLILDNGRPWAIHTNKRRMFAQKTSAFSIETYGEL